MDWALSPHRKVDPKPRLQAQIHLGIAGLSFPHTLLYSSLLLCVDEHTAGCMSDHLRRVF